MKIYRVHSDWDSESGNLILDHSSADRIDMPHVATNLVKECTMRTSQSYSKAWMDVEC